MKNPFFSGVSTALVTPFRKGEIDYLSLKKLMRFQLDGGIEGFVVCGSTGEAATLELKEKLKLLDFVLSEVAGQIPVIVGSGTNNTKESIELTKKFDRNKKLSGFLIVTPYYNKPPQRGLVAHFKAIAKATKKPAIIYNVPSRTVVSLKVTPTVKELSKVKNIVGIKEAAGDLQVIRDLVQEMPKGFSILSGDDETFVKAQGLGANGVISVVSHLIPKMCTTNSSGNEDKIIKLSKAIFVESNPIPVKWALKEMGIIKSAELRLPLVTLEESYHYGLKQTLKELEVL